MSSQVDQPPKKKRTCDPCKLRRIKCDLLTLLSAIDGPGTRSEDEPAHLIVRRHPGQICTQCRNKGLQCSTEGILNPLKPNKGGKRIDEARQRFGGDTAAPTPAIQGSDSIGNEGGMDWMNGPGYDGLLHQLGIPQSANEGLHEPPAGLEAPSYPVHDNWQNNPSQPSFSTSRDIPQVYNQSTSPVSDQSNDLLQSLLNNMDNFPSSFASSTNGYPAVYPTPPSRATPEIQRQAVELWDKLSVNTPQTIANRSLRPPAPSSQDEAVDLDGHTLHPNTLIPGLGRLDIETNTFLPVVPLDSNRPKAASGARPGEAYGTHSGRPEVMVRSDGIHGGIPTGQKGKRQRTYDSAGSSPSPSTFERLQPWERDPWHIWQAKDENGSHTVAWSRKEQVQESLADKALGIELSRHLITVYFQAVHFSLPVLSPESFYTEWESCGRRADRMSPASEALCAVLEAWASRYSDNPAILGLPYQHAHTAPKVITSQGQFTPGSKGRAHWGKARLPVCNALLDRAGRVIDAASLLRRPSVTGLQALSLYNQLMHMSDQGSRVKDQWIQNMVVHSTIIEQMRLLQMFWTTGDPILTSEESNRDTLQLRMKQRRLFWTTAVADACWASATGLPPKMPEEELQAGRAWVDEVMDNLPNSTMKMLAFFMKVWHRLSMVGRRIALEITKYNDKKGNIPVNTFCTSIQQCWGEIRSIVTELNESALGLLGACEPGILGFSPLNYITNMRLCCPFFLLVLHEAIRNHLAFRQSFYSSYVVDPEVEGQAANQRDEDLGMLNKIHLQSVDVLLYNCRSQMNMFKDLLPTGILQSASIMIRVLIASGQFMAEVPTNEQGYPASTLGGYDWTWEEKQRCIQICTDALYQIGWAWSDVSDVLDAINLSMERMTPPDEDLESYAKDREAINVKIQMQRSREMKIEHDGLQAALRFWPPKSIPAIIAISRDNSNLIDMEHHRLRLGEAYPNGYTTQSDSLRQSQSTSSTSATPSINMYNTCNANQSTGTTPLKHHKEVDTFLTNTVPGFHFHSHNPASNPNSNSHSNSNSASSSSSPDKAEVSQSLHNTPSAGLPGFEVRDVDGMDGVETFNAVSNEDQLFWDMINGGSEEVLDFSAFLQNFNEDGSAM